MADFYFFTDYDLLGGQPQTSSEAFGPINSLSYRISSTHTFNSGSSPSAYAVCDGEIIVQKYGSNEACIILKPKVQPGFDLPNVKYYIYKGIDIASLLSGTNIKARNNDGNYLIERLWKDQEDDPDSTTPTEAKLGVQFVHNASDPSLKVQDDDNIDKLFEKREDFAPFSVTGGLNLGTFNSTGGIQICFDEIFNDHKVHFARELESTVNTSSLPTTPSNKEIFDDLLAREKALHYLDPAAFFGSFYTIHYPLFARESSDQIGEFEELFGSSASLVQQGSLIIYNTLIKGVFLNANRTYVDIRNEHNFSFNIYGNYSGNNISNAHSVNIKLGHTTDPQTPLTSTQYTTNSWPILIIDNSSFPTTNTEDFNLIALELPEGDNPNPVVYLRHGIVDFDTYIYEQKQPRFYNLSCSSSYTERFYVITPNNTLNNPNDDTENIASYIRLKCFHRHIDGVKPTFANKNLCSLGGIDALFPIFDMVNNLPGGIPNTGNLSSYSLSANVLYRDPNESYIYIGKPKLTYGNGIVDLEIPLYRYLDEYETSPILLEDKNLSKETDIDLSNPERNASEGNTKIVKSTESKTSRLRKYSHETALPRPSMLPSDFLANVAFSESIYNQLVALRDALSSEFDTNYPVYLGLRDETIDNAKSTATYKLCLLGYKQIDSGADVVVHRVDTTITMYGDLNSNYYGWIAPEDLSNDLDPNEVVVNTPIDSLTGSVGLGGDNANADVEKIQNRLNSIGYLSDDVINSADRYSQDNINETIKAISKASRCIIGLPLILIDKDSPALKMINSDLAADSNVGNVNIEGVVGPGDSNDRTDNAQLATDRSAVANRLKDLGFLAEENINNDDEIHNAIKKFHNQMLGSSYNKFRPYDADAYHNVELDFLNYPYLFKMKYFKIAKSVGKTGTNNADDLAKIRNRLIELGYLTAGQKKEDVDNGNNIKLEEAIEEFQEVRGMTKSGLVKPFDETHRLLIRPSLPPFRDMIHAGGATSVIRGGSTSNNPTDVRMYQKRMHELGFLSIQDFIDEYDDVATNATSFKQSFVAIENFQKQLLNSYNDPGASGGNGTTRFWIQDPTFGTLSNFNINARNDDFALDNIVFSDADCRIVDAIRRKEVGNASHENKGEAGAETVTGAACPTSYGVGQNTVETIRVFIHGSTELINYYRINHPDNDYNGSDTRSMTYDVLVSSIRMQAFFCYIINADVNATTVVPAGNGHGENLSYSAYDGNNTYGMTKAIAENTTDPEGALSTAISSFKSANNTIVPTTHGSTNLEAFIDSTGMPESTIERLFRTAKLFRNLKKTSEEKSTESERIAYFESQTSGMWLENLDSLRIPRKYLETYFGGKALFFNECLEGFLAKTIFSHPVGQLYRNALTDDRGQGAFKLNIKRELDKTTVDCPSATGKNRAYAVAVKHNGGNALQYCTQNAPEKADYAVYAKSVIDDFYDEKKNIDDCDC